MTPELLNTLDLPDEAVDFLLSLWTLIQGLDDWHDGTPADTSSAIWAACVGIPGNGFLAAHRQIMVPVMANAVMKWHAANIIEANKEIEQFPKSFVWRACYYDVVLQVVLIVHGSGAKEKAAMVLRMYGEKLADYHKEQFHV